MVALFQTLFNQWENPFGSFLEGSQIRLSPLDPSHFATLVELGKDSRIWTNFPSDRGDASKHLSHLSEIKEDMDNGSQLAFVIEEKASGAIAGMTRLYHLNQSHRQLEIGSWLHPNFWSSGINTESKFLLLTFCFEALQTIRVQFRTDVTNQRSRQALEKMGATLEGVIRNERIKDDGTYRHAAVYSIIEQEWAEVKALFVEKLSRYSPLQMAS